ncbi:putative T6SS immunity periplasmic lipoprotein [Cronobacter sakazakii]|uniref:putative T6SS immunity periplasmic lipoprotein n=1 Tax=Cronobacter sakazakii TaxID=28141 RepID=UPI000CFD60C0|nr:hypothetical protein [Cronobacter sakazakii]EKY1983147.1 hypothetical protein [Cronobacter sakazakii]EKY2000601.1 hypothetical protein [Cronobacter sakazakii]ELY6092168.1 hypothetical protein [Cronobacter sakazakii]
MVSENNVNTFNLLFLSFACVSILTGCPGPGDIMRFDETAKVSSRGRDVCINIDNTQDYQPVDIGINLRGIPQKRKSLIFHQVSGLVPGSCVFLLHTIVLKMVISILLNLYFMQLQEIRIREVLLSVSE